MVLAKQIKSNKINRDTTFPFKMHKIVAMEPLVVCDPEKLFDESSGPCLSSAIRIKCIKVHALIFDVERDIATFNEVLPSNLVVILREAHLESRRDVIKDSPLSERYSRIISMRTGSV